MKKFREQIDNIFEGLYGNKFDEEGVLFSECYEWEVNSMEQDYNEYIRCMELTSLTLDVEQVAKFIVFLEYMHIGNDHFIRSGLDLKKLNIVANEMLKNRQ